MPEKIAFDPGFQTRLPLPLARLYTRAHHAAFSLLACAGLSAFLSAPALAQVVLETDDLRLEVSAKGLVKSLRTRRTGAEYAFQTDRNPAPFACVYRGAWHRDSQERYLEHEPPLYYGNHFPATAAALEGDRLTLRFDGAGITAAYRVTSRPGYLAFELLSIAGGQIDRIDLVSLRVPRFPNLGRWIDVAWDDRFAICLCGGNIRTTAALKDDGDRGIEMRAIASREVALEGTIAVLFGCTDPREKFLDAMEVVERDLGMPAGARNRRSPSQAYSYLWANPTPADVDRWIAITKRCGLRTLLLSYSAFTQGAGHFRFNDSYPRGITDLKDVTDRIRAAGLEVGIHLHYSKADRTDPYVTPVPDNRLHAVRSFTVAEAIDASAAEVPVQENPAASELADGRRILKAGKELIAYRDYTTQPPYRFTGCERNHLGTAASAHGAGETAKLLDVDDWVKFIRFDQDTDIQDEAARRIAEILNATGPWKMVYFDGAEDVHPPFWYHVASAQHRVYRLLHPAPPVCEAAMNSHFGWHFITRGNAYDLPRGHIKAFCRQISCREAPVRAMDFTRINFGWVFEMDPDMGPDVLEYVMSRGAAWDCPFSLRLSLDEAAAHPRADDCFDAVRTWEGLRITGKLPAAQLAALRIPQREWLHVKTWTAVFNPSWVQRWKSGFADAEHHLLIDEKGEPELMRALELVPSIVNGQVKAFVFQRPARPDEGWALVWAKKGELRLALLVAPGRVQVMKAIGTPLPVEAGEGGVVLTISGRLYLRFAESSLNRTIEFLRAARVVR
jgi:hypothetical protein